MSQYLLRLDDACPTMNREKWERMQSLIIKYNIKPIIAVIPDNQDISLFINEIDEKFWSKIKALDMANWEIALHGYNHVYISNCPGINPFHKRSEFAGLPIETQTEKIKKGLEIFQNNNLNPRIFVAPSHTFDLNTLKAITKEGTIRIISDTIAFRPYYKYGLFFIPQQFGTAKNMILPGLWTFCYHPNTMTSQHFFELEHFLDRNSKEFISVNDLLLNERQNMTFFDYTFKKIFFLYRKGLKK